MRVSACPLQGVARRSDRSKCSSTSSAAPGVPAAQQHRCDDFFGNYSCNLSLAASKLVDALVAGKFVLREEGTVDRRRVALKLTAAGRRKYTRLVEDAESYLAERIQHLAPATRAEVVRGLEALHTIFEDPSEVRRTTEKRKYPTS